MQGVVICHASSCELDCVRAVVCTSWWGAGVNLLVVLLGQAVALLVIWPLLVNRLPPTPTESMQVTIIMGSSMAQ
jgi:hypothetical protein